MNRARRPAKPFVAGGVYDPSQGGTPTAAAAPPTPRNYSYQNTPKRLPQTPQQSKNATPVVVQEPIVPEKVVPVVVPPPVLKDEPVSIPQDEENNQDEEMHVEEEDGGDSISPKKKGKVMFKKIFAIRKKASVRAKEKKIRQNRQLRKVILPKNALMALNEVKGINVGDFVINSNVGGGFSAVVCVNGNQYEGKGSSKVLAKNNACEKALRDYVLAKMRQKPRLQSRTTSVSGETAMDTSEENGENAENGENGESQTQDEADDVPMINLTSFALYKLFSEWENEGFEIPEFHPSANASANANDSDGNAVVKEPKKPAIQNELPANWETMHPASLLCMMRPGVTYSDYGLVGEKRNAIQSLGVIVDDQEFVGKGRSKKIARRNAAANVCNTLFGTTFEPEEPISAPAAS